jgi:hydrogenase/urease accessory protein HupE
MAENRQQPETEYHDNHGQSIASWTCVTIVALGFLLATIAVVAGSIALAVIGAVVVVLGAISGKVLAAMGFGISGKPGH